MGRIYSPRTTVSGYRIATDTIGFSTEAFSRFTSLGEMGEVGIRNGGVHVILRMYVFTSSRI